MRFVITKTDNNREHYSQTDSTGQNKIRNTKGKDMKGRDGKGRGV